MNGMWELESTLKIHCHSVAENKRGDDGLSAQKRKRAVSGCGKQYPAEGAKRHIRIEVEGPVRREGRVRVLACE